MKKKKYSLSKQINIVVVGTGKAGAYHLDALTNIGNINVVGVMNSGRKDPIELRKKYNINRWIKDVTELKEIQDLDALIVAVSSKQTIKLIRLFAKLNVHCLIEKPLGIHPSESKEISLLLESSDKMNFVGFNRRFYSSFLQAQNYMNRLGAPISIHIDASEPHSRLLSRGKNIDEVNNRLLLNTTHAIDFFIFMFGKPIAVSNFDHNSHRNGSKIDFMSFLNFSENRSGSFLSHWFSPGPWLFKIYGEDYQIILNLTRNKGELFSEEFGNVKFDVSEDDITCKPGVLKQNYFFLKSIINKKKAHDNLCEIYEAHLNNELTIELSK